MSDNALRSLLFASILQNREDIVQRQIIANFPEVLDYDPISSLMISSQAWEHVSSIKVEPKFVFSHPKLLTMHPTTSLYYRGMAFLSRKRVSQTVTSVVDWEDGKRNSPIPEDKAKRVASFYNTMISLIIDSTQNWSIEDGYRNIHASMGITLDSMFRNKIGDMAESLIKYRMIAWLKAKRIIPIDKPKSREYDLPNDMLMRYRSEPDIEFTREGRRIATIEIKGGRDPAGALERLGAMTKSFAETSPGCVDFLVAGVITPEMQKRLDTMGNIKVYQMDQITQDKECWDEFMNEIFHHTIRII